MRYFYAGIGVKKNEIHFLNGVASVERMNWDAIDSIGKSLQEKNSLDKPATIVNFIRLEDGEDADNEE